MKIILAFASVLFAGCATTGQTDLLDFNEHFGMAIPTSPKFKIEPLARNRFQVVVYQGAPLIGERTTRSSFLNRAAFIAMEAECKKSGPYEIGDHQLRDDVDGWGYINVMGSFTCAPAPPH